MSRRTFEHVNFIAQKIRGIDTKPFGGIQVIAVGDFRRLSTVSNDIDNGEYCFESPLWNTRFPHCVELATVYRQNQKEFVEVLNQLSSDEITEETSTFIKEELANKILCPEDHGVKFVPHIFCNNFNANYFNMTELVKLPGEIKVYHSTDSTDERLLDKVTLAESRLRVKVGAEVMLVYNLSTKLRNGVKGKVVLLEDDGPTVEFTKVGIPKCTWFAYKPGTSKVVGERQQFPIKLAWAFTVHKAQGQTMDAVVVHSSNEFTSSQSYVACSRVTTKEGLSIIGFNKRKLIKQDSRVVEFYKVLMNKPVLPNCICCKNRECLSPFPDNYNLDIEGGSCIDTLSDHELSKIEKHCQLFEQSSQETAPGDPNVLLESLRNSSVPVMHFPSDVDTKYFLIPVCSDEGSLKERMNSLITKLQTQHLNKFEIFLKTNWNRIETTISHRTTSSRGLEKVDFKGIRSDEIEILTSNEIGQEFSSVNEDSHLQVHHHCVLTEIVKKVRTIILKRKNG